MALLKLLVFAVMFQIPIWAEAFTCEHLFRTYHRPAGAEKFKSAHVDPQTGLMRDHQFTLQQSRVLEMSELIDQGRDIPRRLLPPYMLEKLSTGIYRSTEMFNLYKLNLAFLESIRVQDLFSDMASDPQSPQVIREFARMKSLPSPVAFHPETMVYLIANGIVTWWVRPTPGKYDGITVVSSRVDFALHDIMGHASVWHSANQHIPIRERVRLFRKMWSEFINVEQQSHRVRDLRIMIVFYMAFDSGIPFARGDMKEFLVEEFLQTREINYFVDRLNRPNDIGTSILKEQPVNKMEIFDQSMDLLAWMNGES